MCEGTGAASTEARKARRRPMTNDCAGKPRLSHASRAILGWDDNGIFGLRSLRICVRRRQSPDALSAAQKNLDRTFLTADVEVDQSKARSVAFGFDGDNSLVIFGARFQFNIFAAVVAVALELFGIR